MDDDRYAKSMMNKMDELTECQKIEMERLFKELKDKCNIAWAPDEYDRYMYAERVILRADGGDGEIVATFDNWHHFLLEIPEIIDKLKK